MLNHSDGESEALGIVSLFPQLDGSRSKPVPLQRQLGVEQVWQQRSAAWNKSGNKRSAALNKSGNKRSAALNKSGNNGPRR